MAIDLVELIHLKVTSIVMEGETTNLFEKENALNQFYPFLLRILSEKPDLVSRLTNQLNPRLSDLFETNPALKNDFLEQVSGSAPTSDIENTLSAAIAPTFGLLQAEAGSSEPEAVSYFLNQNEHSITRNLPHWATTFLTALGIGTVASNTTAASPIVESDPEPTYVMAEEEPQTNKWLPIIALLIGLAILALLFKACSDRKEAQPIAADTTQSVTGQPAALTLTTGTTGALAACSILIGDAQYLDVLQGQIKQIFTSPNLCGAENNNTYHNAFIDQDTIPSVLKFVQGMPNVALTWVGDQVSVQAASDEDAQKIADYIRSTAKNVKVTTQQAVVLDVDNTVNNSISAAEKALASIQTDNVKAIDVATALNMQIINFASASSEIPVINKSILDQAAALIKRANHVQLTIEGHTDATGDAAANKKLSHERAKSVMDYLITQGVDPSQLQAVGFGQEKPKADNATEDGKFRNRRIEFQVLNKETGTVRHVDEEGVKKEN